MEHRRQHEDALHSSRNRPRWTRRAREVRRWRPRSRLEDPKEHGWAGPRRLQSRCGAAWATRALDVVKSVRRCSENERPTPFYVTAAVAAFLRRSTAFGLPIHCPMNVKSKSRGSSPSRAFGALPLLSPCSDLAHVVEANAGAVAVRPSVRFDGLPRSRCEGGAYQSSGNAVASIGPSAPALMKTMNRTITIRTRFTRSAR